MPDVFPMFKEPKERSAGAYRRACVEVDERSRGWCEVNVPDVCKPGRHRAEHHHHIVGRGVGGEHTAENLLHICHAAHDWAHNRDRAKAEALGIIARSA